jgi:endo-alpha-1,4-polygalactosaminidase (GH114 family)
LVVRPLIFPLVICLTLVSVSSAQTPSAHSGPITFLNVFDGQFVQAIMPNSPGAVVNVPGGPKSLKVEVLRADGSRWWERHESGALACITGLEGGACNAWTTNYAPDGAYRLRATATLKNGSFHKAEARFQVANTTPKLAPAAPKGSTARPEWNAIRSWMRQDTKCKLPDILKSRFGMVTLSVRCTGKLLAPASLERLKASGKWVLAYEDVAAVGPWDRRVWPGRVNPASKFLKFQTAWGSYLTDVTSDAWFNVLEPIVRDDLARGYDGIWLDDCTGFHIEDNATLENITRYVGIVRRVRALVDSIRPGVKLVCNTDSNLIQSSLEANTGFLELLDGVTLEGFTYHCFGPGDCRANNPVRRAEDERWGLEAQGQGMKIFTLDYAKDEAAQREAWAESRQRGWTPAVNRGPTVGVWID